MATGAFSTVEVWVLVAVLGIGTFALRLSFIESHAWIDEFPGSIERALAFIPPAVLAALVVPEVLTLEDVLAGQVLTPQSIAATVAVVVAWRTESMIATIAVGMAALWTGLFVVG